MTGPSKAFDYEAFRWVQPPSFVRGSPPIGRPGIAEIKPHTKNGIAAGLRQLDQPSRKIPGHDRWLVTYLVSPLKSPTPTHFRVIAYRLTPQGKRQGPWYLGQDKVPATIPLRTDNPALFGMAIEDIVRRKFEPQLVQRGYTVTPGTGGARKGADVRWNELAEFYAELASETGDPFFEALASELTEIAAA